MVQIQSRPLSLSAGLPDGRRSAPPTPPLPKPSQLKFFATGDTLQKTVNAGQSLAQIELLPALEISTDAQGCIRVGGFPPGQPPAIETVIDQVFPQAQNIKILAETHERPFDTYTFSVDGQDYKSSFLSRGFTPSKALSIEALHN
ncbi:hypothetical protein COW36_11885 [bacterium (Candidatus Blackallbacteria) CG17_big_fil_post_rev_8_21_14_2_50_48_46]|uniref:Uncharacterized protein n=1 Tax=bacterium (Candidatus Blackallbacteria) CG17_big_fil_post_rev_8_21_14_2_50_48_46 TaxID=2014261 RepID=A0A2M7G3L0_9BACT|nr:MAG: hypothetical protein COW64_03375 [bacterium (Candidatus Blackallbacteria) CG18_big_fil_WC_8_21_14_2_50_49_26]PIW16463.1 MAG: hypothetical protein COW36_11885 [bacterium (Candidatus Blackallbacteria) CG17_big_fil_post_rev_8_21_14_2_50_48_46]PIW45971.1 MAG: hypothetical protein COW20_17150 [bacterium (Candidatus Blackallbacteria) CG13_big_fil_rev_8_21_14_2_50_49_14]